MIVCEHCLEVRQINPLLDDDDCIAEPDGLANLRAALGFKRRQFARAIEEVQDARPLALRIAPGRALHELDHDATVLTTARKSVEEGKRVEGGVDLGGSRLI